MYTYNISMLIKLRIIKLASGFESNSLMGVYKCEFRDWLGYPGPMHE